MMIVGNLLHSHRAIIWVAALRRVTAPLWRHPLRSPYFKPQIVMARQCTNAATILWACIVISQTDSLVRSHSPLMALTAYVNEDILAALLGIVALAQLLCIWPLQLKPMRHASWGYGLLAFFWGYALFSFYFSSTILFPVSSSTVPIIFGLAFYGFVSIPTVKVSRDGVA